MSNKKVLNIVLIVIGVAMILPLFVGFLNFVMQGGGDSQTYTASLFGEFDIAGPVDYSVKDILTLLDKGGHFFYVVAKIATIVGIIAAIAIAVFAALKLANVKVDLAKIEKIIAIVAMAAAAIMLVSMIIFFIASTKSEDMGGITMKYFFSGAWGWYVAFIGACVSGFLSFRAAK